MKVDGSCKLYPGVLMSIAQPGKMNVEFIPRQEREGRHLCLA